jgi:hypothetical protein
MSEPRMLSRRLALAGLGAGSLGVVMGAQAAARPNVETGGSGGTGAISDTAVPSTASFAGHPLVGMWLTMMALPSHPEDVLAVPAFFGADGSALLIFPCTEANDVGVQVKGAAIGAWAPIDDRYAHFTTVQALSDMEGLYHGTITFDGYPRVNDDHETFDVDSQFDLFTVRDQLNKVISSRSGPHANPMRAYRMHPGNVGFPVAQAESQPSIPEVAPVHPGDPRLFDPQ